MPNIDFNINDDDFMNSFVLDHPEDAPIIKVIQEQQKEINMLKGENNGRHK